MQCAAIMLLCLLGSAATRPQIHSPVLIMELDMEASGDEHIVVEIGSSGSLATPSKVESSAEVKVESSVEVEPNVEVVSTDIMTKEVEPTKDFHFIGVEVVSGDEVISEVGSGDEAISEVGSGDGVISEVGSGDGVISEVGSGDGVISEVGSGDGVISEVGSGDGVISEVGSTEEFDFSGEIWIEEVDSSGEVEFGSEEGSGEVGSGVYANDMTDSDDGDDDASYDDTNTFFHDMMRAWNRTVAELWPKPEEPLAEPNQLWAELTELWAKQEPEPDGVLDDLNDSSILVHVKRMGTEKLHGKLGESIGSDIAAYFYDPADAADLVDPADAADPAGSLEAWDTKGVISKVGQSRIDDINVEASTNSVVTFHHTWTLLLLSTAAAAAAAAVVALITGPHSVGILLN